MFWNKKEDKSGLPDLPPIKIQQKAQENSLMRDSFEQPEEIDRHALPSFPDSPISKGFSQSAIKQAVDEEEDLEEDSILPSIPEIPQVDEHTEIKTPDKSDRFKTVEVEEDNEMRKSMISLPPSNFQAPKIQEPKMQIKTIPAPDPRERSTDIFVKIEKFRIARRSLLDVKERLDEIEEMLSKIREIRQREEQELTSWEKEISSAKTQVENVTSNIFEKVE